jgi:hypothetical protein
MVCPAKKIGIMMGQGRLQVIRFRLGLLGILISLGCVLFRWAMGAWLAMTSPTAPIVETGQIFFEQDCGREGCWRVYYVTATQYNLLEYSEIVILIGLVLGGLLILSATLDGNTDYVRKSYR